MIWALLHHRMTPEHLGAVPGFFDENDPRTAAEQIAARYIGGWHPMSRFRLLLETGVLCYPGDPPLRPIAKSRLRGERLWFYPSSWLAIVAPDGSYEVSRVD